MVNKTINFFLKNKLLAVLITFMLLIGGLISSPFNHKISFLPNIPISVDAIPDIGENQQIIFTQWEGISPQDIEDQVTYPLTNFLMGLPGVKTVRSSSMFGLSSIYIIFEENIDFYWSRSRILEKLNSIPGNLLPEGVNPTLGPDATGLGQIFWYTIEGRDESGNVNGGWDLNELRSIQDFYIKNSLISASGVSEVSSIGGFVQEYQIDVNPEMMRQYSINIQDIVSSIKKTNQDIGAQTIEINNVEYFIRGLGNINSISDIENTVVKSTDYVSIKVKDVSVVSLGPKERRGILDKEGAEVVGGVVVARYGANPMEVINNVKIKIEQISKGLPSKILDDGTKSQLTIVPFYDRTDIIEETIDTLFDALSIQILITFLVVTVMIYNLRASLLISGLLLVTVFSVFIAMNFFNIEANIVALSGIAIAIGTMVDVGIILSENIIKFLNDRQKGESISKVVYRATKEVSGAILTAVTTTILSFIPIFSLIGAEGKLFKPLAFTKTFGLLFTLIIALFLIPTFASMIYKKSSGKKIFIDISLNFLLFIIGIFSLLNQFILGLPLIIVSILNYFKLTKKVSVSFHSKMIYYTIVLSIVLILSEFWRPLGLNNNLFNNILFVTIVTIGVLGLFLTFKKNYSKILIWALDNKLKFLSVPILTIVIGSIILSSTQKEFMPSLNEGSFLLMPTSMPHSGVVENKNILRKLDMAVSSIPEIKTVVGKAGRVESALDPAPISMFENIIVYKPEYLTNSDGKPTKFKVNSKKEFVKKDGSTVKNPNNIENSQINAYITYDDLIEDKQGVYYRNWRPEIKSSDDIWDKIIEKVDLPGVTSSPKLQPIEARLLMLQSGIRSPLAIKIKGQDLNTIEKFGFELEKIIKEIDGVDKETVFADRIIGKPYLLIDINRDKISRYGLNIQDIQSTIEAAIGGLVVTETIEGRERYGVRIRYPRNLRNNPTVLNKIYITTNLNSQILLSELADIKFEIGPQIIKSEDNFLVGYVLFDKIKGFSDVTIINKIESVIDQKINNKELFIPDNINYQFSGTYENQIRSEKSLRLIIPLVLLIIFIILFLQFRSTQISLMVFCGILVAFAGGFILIWLYNQGWFLNINLFGENLRSIFNINTINLSVAVWVGFIALFGIATDDGVLMATYLNQSFKKNNPRSISEIRNSIVEAGERRITPCLMTTATTLIALLPILTSNGRGSDIMIPMAIPIFGGMLIAIMTLFVVPILYSLRAESNHLKIKNNE